MWVGRRGRGGGRGGGLRIIIPPPPPTPTPPPRPQAEAQCAALAKADKVYAAASEDMDTLTFGAPRLVRRMWASEAQKLPVLEFNLPKVLAGMGLTYEQFVDVCILSGCDYCDTIRGIGATTALKQVKAQGSLEAVIASLDKTKYPQPEGVDYAKVRRRRECRRGWLVARV